MGEGMNIEDATLGKLTKDHLQTHQQVARQKAELEQMGDYLILLGNNLKNRPQDIRIGEDKITLKSERNEERIVLPSQLDICQVLRRVQELNELLQMEERLETGLKNAGMGYIVDGLKSRKQPTRDILQNYR